MKIGINARFLTKPYTGIGQHTKYLFSALAETHPEIRLVMVVPEEIDVHMPGNVEICVLKENFFGTAGMRKTYWEQRQVPRFLLQKQVDLVHFPYPSNPWNAFAKPVAVTVHDTIPWTSEIYRRSISTRLYQDTCRFAVKKADHVFTVSHVSEEEIIRLCSVPKEKISISFNAPAPMFFNNFSEEQKAGILQKYGVDPKRPFFFYIGGYDHRKNVQTLVSVFESAVAPNFGVDLVMAGGKNVDDILYASFDRLTNSGNRGNFEAQKGSVVMTGFVAEEDLPALYQSSLAFINLSEKEGCNLPLLEAAASKVPLIVSDIPVHHEMIGGYALYCKAHDETKFAELMTGLLSNKNFYDQQKQKISQYACPFSWNKTADQVYQAYQKLLSL